MSAWHSASHDDPDSAGGQQMIKMQAFLAGQFVYMVNKLKSYSDGPYSLLDNTAVVLGTQNGSSTQSNPDHDPRNTPLVVAGSAGGAWTTGRVVDCGGRNQNDLYLSITKAFGMATPTIGNPAWCKGPMI